MTITGHPRLAFRQPHWAADDHWERVELRERQRSLRERPRRESRSRYRRKPARARRGGSTS